MSETKEGIANNKLSRRSMLKWIGALGVGVVAGVGGDMILRPTAGPPAATTTTTGAAAVENYVYTCCPGGACHEECVFKTVVDTTPPGDHILRIERLQLGGQEAGRDHICAKGIMSAQLPDMPTRVLYPMKRVGARGEGKFQRISWDQAISEIGAQLKQIVAKYGPQAVATKTSACGSRPTTLMGAMFSRWNYITGAHTFDHPPVDESSEFAVPSDFGVTSLGGYRDVRYLADTNMVIFIGCNPMSTRPSNMSFNLMEAKNKGAKFVVLGRWFDQTAAKADQFIPVKAGQDGALLLAMARVMIDENLIDTTFLANCTVAPFLVRSDNGLFLRESDMVSGGSKTKFVWWDGISKSAQSIAAAVFKFPIGTAPDLLASQTVNGIACKTAFLKLKESLANITPQSQANMTGVPADVCTQLARDYCNNRPATFYALWGYRYQNGGRVMRAMNLLAALSGNLGLTNGRIIEGSTGDGNWPMYLNTTPVVTVSGMKNQSLGSALWRDENAAVATGKPIVVKAFIEAALSGLTYPRILWHKMYSNLELIVQSEFRFTDNTAWCDYVLPDKTQFEEYEIDIQPANSVHLQEPAIKPRGEAKGLDEFFALLSKQMGISQYFYNADGTYITNQQWIDLIMKQSQPGVDPTFPVARANTVAGITLDRLKQEKVVRANVPTIHYPGAIWANNPQAMEGSYGGITGRMEFYHEEYADIGEAIATIAQPWINGGGPGSNKANLPDRTKYPLQYVSYRERLFMQGQFNDISTLNKIVSGGMGTAPLWINPATAAARGISEGDVCEVFNDRGSAFAKAHLSEVFPPDMVNISMSWRRDQYVGGGTQDLLTNPAVPETDDTLTTKLIANSALGHAGWDLLWDGYCEVRKGTPTTPNQPYPQPVTTTT